MSDEARFDPRFDPAFQPGFEGPLAAQAPVRPVVAPSLSLPPAILPPDAVVAMDATGETPAGINPFVVVLGVVALAFVGGGMFLASRLQEMFATTRDASTIDFSTALLFVYSAPLMIALGAATAIGVLFLFALRWGRR